METKKSNVRARKKNKEGGGWGNKMLRLEIYLGETTNVITLGHRLNDKHSDAANTSCISHESSNTSMDQQLSSCPVSFLSSHQ